MRHLSSVLKALGDETRLRIVKMLQAHEMCVCQVTWALGMSQSTVSKHLAVLKQAGLVDDVGRGKWVFYRLSEQALNSYAPALLRLMRGWLDDDPQVLADAKKAKQVLKMSLEDVCRR